MGPLPVMAALVEDMRGEFLNLPGPCLTESQACRFWNVEPLVCAAILQALVDTGFLIKTPTGLYCTYGTFRLLSPFSCAGA